MYQLTKSPNIILRIEDNAAIPVDVENKDYQEYQLWLAQGNIPQAVLTPTPTQFQQDVIIAVQNRLDTFAQTRNYDGILSACSYATSKNVKFQSEGQYCVDARDATWQKCYDIMAAVQAGTQLMPSNVDEVLNQLPALVWPV